MDDSLPDTREVQLIDREMLKRDEENQVQGTMKQEDESLDKNETEESTSTNMGDKFSSTTQGFPSKKIFMFLVYLKKIIVWTIILAGLSYLCYW